MNYKTAVIIAAKSFCLSFRLRGHAPVAIISYEPYSNTANVCMAHCRSYTHTYTLPGVLPDALTPPGGHPNWRLAEPGGDQSLGIQPALQVEGEGRERGEGEGEGEGEGRGGWLCSFLGQQKWLSPSYEHCVPLNAC